VTCSNLPAIAQTNTYTEPVVPLLEGHQIALAAAYRQAN
jgi:hypothetical protein